MAMSGFDAGCMKCGEKAGEKIAEKAVQAASRGKAKVDVGSVDISGLPANLRYPGAVAKAKWEISTDEGTGTNYTFETPDPKAKVVEFYKNALSSWKKSMSSETPEVTTMAFTGPDEKEMVIVAIRTEQGKSTINLTYTRK
jgi:hypothetical protein